MAKQSYDLLQTDRIIRAYIWHYYLLLVFLTIRFILWCKGTQKKIPNEFENCPIKKKESFGHGKLVSPVIGGWARCAPSPTTGAAGHDVAAA